MTTMRDGDLLAELPSDQNMPSNEEIHLVDSLFKRHKGVIILMLDGMKDILIIGLLFLIFSLPQCDSLIKKFIPSTNNSIYILLLIKTLIFMVIFFLIKNFYLARKH